MPEKKGSFFRCVTPILLYIAVQIVATIIVTIWYYFEKNLSLDSSQTIEQFTDYVMTSMLNDMGKLNFLITIVSYAIMIPLFIRIMKKDNIRNLTAEDKKNSVDIPKYMYLFLIILGCAATIAATNMISLSGIVDKSEGYTDVMEVLYSTGFLQQLILMGLLAPITEEILFRGIIYRRYKEFLSTIPSIICSAVVFAIMHVNIVQGIYAFFMGLLLCYVYERFNSIKAPVLVHLSANIIAVISTKINIFELFYTNMIVFYLVTFIFCMIIVAVVYIIESKQIGLLQDK